MAIYRVTNSCLVDGQTCQNVFHLDSGGGPMLETTICDKVAASWIPNITPFQHTGAQWISVEVRSVSPAGPASFKKIIAIFGSGPAEGDQDNSMLCRMLAFRTATAGRHGRGFLFIPGTSFQAWTKGLVKPASLTAGGPSIVALKNHWTGGAPAQGLNLVLSRKSAPGTVIQVIDILQDPIIRAVRRRRLGIGI